MECTSDLGVTASDCKVGDAGLFVLTTRSMSQVKPGKRLERPYRSKTWSEIRDISPGEGLTGRCEDLRC